MNVRLAYFYIILSATLTFFAFLLPDFLWWFVFICFVTLFYVHAKKEAFISFSTGFFWGTIFFCFQTQGLLRVIIDHTKGRGGLFAWLLFVIYCSLWSGFIFWAISMCGRFLKNRFLKTLCMGLFIIFFFYWVEHGILLIFGRYEGYPLCHLLLPLTVYPQILFFVPIIGSLVLIFCIVLCNMFVALFVISGKQNMRFIYLIGIFACLSPFVVGVCFRLLNKIPDYIKHIMVVVPKSTSHNQLDCAQNIAEQITDCADKNRDINFIIMPESSYQFPLNEYLETVGLLGESLLSDETTLVLGAHRRENGKLYNSLYCIDWCRIINVYDKKHLIPFVEYLPNHFNIPFFKGLFLNKKKQFNVSNNRRQVLHLGHEVEMVPYICSELFWGCERPEEWVETILCIANDSWFSSRSMRRLLSLLSYYRAIEWQKNILYVSHYYAQWIDPSGNSLNLSVSI